MSSIAFNFICLQFDDCFNDCFDGDFEACHGQSSHSTQKDRPNEMEKPPDDHYDQMEAQCDDTGGVCRSVHCLHCCLFI